MLSPSQWRSLLSGRWSGWEDTPLTLGGCRRCTCCSSAADQSLVGRAKLRYSGWELENSECCFFFFGTSAVELSLLVIYHLPVVPEIWGGRGSTCHTHTHTSGWMPSNPPAERLSRAPEFRGTHGELQNTKVSERQRVWWHVWIWYRWCRDAEVWWWEVKWWAPRLIVNGLLTELLFVLLQNVSEQDVLCCERMHRYKL